MKKIALIIWLLLLIVFMLPSTVTAQFFSGYYSSEPQVEGFHHFKIKHHQEHEGKYEGVFSMKAYVADHLVWEREAVTIHGDEADRMVADYGEGKEIVSVHKLRMLWDGVEWDFFFLGYLDAKGHGRFIVVEEIFSDETETDLLSIDKFHWSKGRHFQAELTALHN